MSLNAEILRDAIIEEISKSDMIDKLSVHNAIAKAIKMHVIDNALLNGEYNGMMPAGSSDPNNGKHKWKPSACEISGSLIASSIGGDNHENAIKQYGVSLGSSLLSALKFEGESLDANVIISEIPMVELDVEIEMDNESKQIDAMLNVASAIVDGITYGFPTPSIAGTTSVGSGTVTFTKVE